MSSEVTVTLNGESRVVPSGIHVREVLNGAGRDVVGGAGQPHPGMAAQSRQHELERTPETGNAQPQLPLAHRPPRQQSCIAMLTILSGPVRCDKRKGDGPRRRERDGERLRG